VTVGRDGIGIPRELAEAEGVPEDLDANAVEEYSVPDPARRAMSGRVYVVGALLCGIGALAGLGVGMWWMAGALAVLAAWHFAAAWPLEVREAEAFEQAGAALDFTVGHASAAIRFEGLRAKPVWNVILYDAEEPPTQRALVFVDGVTGELRREPFVEALA
jgi:hypothetical protein